MEEDKSNSIESNPNQSGDNKSNCSGKNNYNRPPSVNAQIQEEMLTQINPYNRVATQQPQSQVQRTMQNIYGYDAQQQQQQQRISGYLSNDQQNYFTLQSQHSQQASQQAQQAQQQAQQQQAQQQQQMLMNSQAANYIQTPTGEIIPVSTYASMNNPSQPLMHSNVMPNYADAYNNLALQQQMMATNQCNSNYPQNVQFDQCPTICSLFAIFCCPITFWCSLTALAYSLCAYTDYKADDILQYKKKSDKARRLVISACIIGLLVCIIWAILTFVYYNEMIFFLQEFLLLIRKQSARDMSAGGYK